MYPQMTGTLQVPALTFHGIIQESNGFNPFEAFGIDGGSTNFKKDIVAPGLAVKVLPLPIVLLIFLVVLVILIFLHN